MAAQDEAGRRETLVANIATKARSAPDPREYIRTLTLEALRSLSNDAQLPVAERAKARREIHELMKLATNQLLAARLTSVQAAPSAPEPEPEPERESATPPEGASPR
jgi:hypothetical protein